MEKTDVDISVVIPVYNSRSCLPELLKQLTLTLNGTGKSYEIILVDDSSPDNSWQVIAELAPQYPRVSAVRLMRNAGQARATICGLSHARGAIVVTMDDDLQHPPDQLPILLDALAADPDIDCVFGHLTEKHHALYRNLASRVIRWVNTRAFGLPRGVKGSGFRAMRRRAAEAVLEHHTANPAIIALVCDSTHRVTSVPVKHAQRYAGRSNYTLAGQFRLALDNICNVSMLPLRVVSGLGIGVCLLSSILVVAILIRFFTGKIGVPGWTTVVVLVSFFAGVTLLSVGILGEYLVRVLREVSRSPLYIERERIGPASKEHPTG